MKLALFDIDGTLTDTSPVDAECYLRALELEFGLAGVDDDWSRYPHSSDPGILDQVFAQQRGRPPRPREVASFQARFLALLEEAWRAEPGRFAEMPGAGAMLGHLMSSPSWAVAIATGGWEVTARFKLRAAGLDVEGAPFASGDDATPRQDILRVAMGRAREAGAAGGFARVVSLGDGVWDVQAARDLGLAFVGVGPGEKLRQAGARLVTPDYRDLPAFLALLESA